MFLGNGKLSKRFDSECLATREISPRVDYALTSLGKKLLEPVTTLAVWAQKHRGEIMRARGAFGVA